MSEIETKICDECDAEVGKSEEKCPKCGTVFAELDELANAVERGSKILEKRKKRIAPQPETQPQPQPKPSFSERLRGLGKLTKKG